MDKWIPVSERLPESNGYYLVSGGEKIWICELCNIMGMKGWINDAKNPIVEAWLPYPLPKPYKAERTDNGTISPCEDTAKECVGDCFKCRWSGFYKAESAKKGKCRTCKYGEVYNDSWCKCQHPIIGGVRIKISDNCIAEEVIEVNRRYQQRIQGKYEKMSIHNDDRQRGEEDDML